MNWSQRYGKKEKKPIVRTCIQCGKEYTKNPKYTLYQWRIAKYCSRKCSGESKKIKDQYKDKQERFRRKRGSLKQRTPEWLELIRSTTKDAMKKPEIQEKLRKSRSPLKNVHKAKILSKLTGRMPSNMMFSGNGSYPNVKRGEYDINGHTFYFRSRWEANYALYLDFLIKQGQIKSWEYEADIFVFDKIQFGTRSYRPDFKITNMDDTIEYHEIKGYLDGRSKTKLRRMLKYYPDTKLILIDRPLYEEIKKKLGRTLGFFE